MAVCKGEHRGAAQAGIALVLVLWVLSLLTIMALGLTTTQRSQNALAQNQLDGARFRALAEGAVNLAVLNLVSNPVGAVASDALWVPDGTPRELEFGGQKIEIRIFNEASRIDLNQATHDQLSRLLELAGAPAGEIDAIAGAITDWRDHDQFAAVNGAEDDAYRSEGFGYGAADQDFESVEELLQLRGMSPELFWSLQPDLRVSKASKAAARGPSFFADGTSAGGSLPFNARFASARALSAMQALSLEEAEQIVAERDQTALEGAQTLRTGDRGGPQYRIRVTVSREDDFARMLEVLVSIGDTSSSPFEILSRREALQTDTKPEPVRD